MDVVPDRDLLDFIDGLDVKEKGTSLNTKVCDKEEEKAEETDVWQEIADALNNWTQRILDSEIRRAARDLTELRYIADLWTNLLNATSCYAVGCVFVKRDIITYLLELYLLRQITSSLYIYFFFVIRITYYNQHH